jgi:hypothetical protein
VPQWKKWQLLSKRWGAIGSLFGQIDKGQQQISANQQANQQSLHELSE